MTTFDWETGSLSDADEYLKVLYYGDAKTGKTTAVTSMANLGRVVILDADSELKPSPLRAHGVSVENLLPLPPASTAVTYDYVDRLFFQLDKTLRDDPGSIAGVILDSGSGLSRIFLEEIVVAAVAQSRKAGKQRARFKAELGDYGTLSESMRSLLRRFKTLPCHLALTALSRRDQDESDMSVHYGPALTPAVATDTLGLVDIIIHTRVVEVGDDVQYRGLCEAGSKYAAGDRFNQLPRTLINPSFERVLAYVRGDLTEATDDIQLAARAATKEN